MDDCVTSIDPNQLLSAISPLLQTSGAARGAVELEHLMRLMKKAQDLVSRCVYLNVLKATTDVPLLNKFVRSGGWQLLDEWLKSCVEEAEDAVFLQELLYVYLSLPVTVELLRSRSTPKTIKQLSRGEAENGVKTLSTEIVNKWMDVIRGAAPSKGDSGITKAEKKKKSSSSGTNDLSSKVSKSASDSDSVKSSKKDKSDKTTTSKDSSATEKPENSKGDTPSKPNVGSSTTKKDLSSSAKELSSGRDPSKSPSSLVNTNQPSPDSKSSSDKSVHKKPRTAKTAPTKFRSTGLETESALPPAKRKTSSTADKPPVKRASTSPGPALPEKKQKIEPKVSGIGSAKAALNIVTKEETHGRIKLIPAKPKPVEIHESSGFMDALTTQIAPPLKVKKKKSGNAPKTPTSPQDKGPPTLTKQNGRLSPTSPTSDKPPVLQDANMSPRVEDDKTSQDSRSKDGEDESVSSETSDKKKKKKVHWASDRELRKYYYFDLDENERVNVNRVKSFGDFRKQEMMMEGAMLKKGMRNDKPEAESKVQMQWQPPRLITGLPQSNSLPGQNSTECETQRKREETVLQAIFFNRAMIPDSAAEADSEEVEYKEPVLIPLDDDGDNVIDHSNVEPPTPATAVSPTSPEFSLPPNVASMLSQLASEISDKDGPATKATADITNSYSANGTSVQPSIPTPDELHTIMQSLANGSAGLDMSVPPPGVNPAVMHQFQQMVQQGLIPPPSGFPVIGRGLLPPPPPGMPPYPPFPPRPGMPGPPRHGRGFRHGPPPGRPWGPPRGQRPRAVCRHFSSGHCSRGNMCTFLHPGLNGPLM